MKTAHSMSSSSLRKKSDLMLCSKVRFRFLQLLLANLQEVLLGTKLSLLFPAIPFAILAQYYNFGDVSAFLLRLIYFEILENKLFPDVL